MQLLDGLKRVRERIAAACEKAGRSEDEVRVVAVTKYVDVPAIEKAVAQGIVDIGENRVQEARVKFPQLPPHVIRHMIGHVQTNKARHVVELFHWVHSLDRLSLAQSLSKRATAAGKNVDCLVQVNVSGEESKYGVAPDDVFSLLEEVCKIQGIRVRGLMTMAPHTSDAAVLRHVFQSLRRIKEKIEAEGFPGVSMEHLSMGMSNDFEIAIEEGATMVRIGRAIFS